MKSLPSDAQRDYDYGRSTARKAPEHEGKEIEPDRGISESPEKEGPESTTQSAEDHHDWIWEPVGEMAQCDLTNRGDGIKQGRDDCCRQLIRDVLREACDVHRDEVIRHSLVQIRDDLCSGVERASSEGNGEKYTHDASEKSDDESRVWMESA
ncbi:hypothetical protein BD310DRAFT_502595 [Dichomitus squalens]|uniref:Uncharacterized protein n=1 Tax=Dichomitus squalens TaxID=114155 RepID=A0A4V2K803_9APHY|nr:hypothetical protein BD310DRAFT_502595 [Dichomitus squalens]